MEQRTTGLAESPKAASTRNVTSLSSLTTQLEPSQRFAQTTLVYLFSQKQAQELFSHHLLDLGSQTDHNNVNTKIKHHTALPQVLSELGHKEVRRT